MEKKNRELYIVFFETSCEKKKFIDLDEKNNGAE